MKHLTRRTTGLTVAIALVLSLYAGVASALTEIVALSNRADLFSGGDALVEVIPPPPELSTIDLDGIDVKSDFTLGAGGRYIGLLTNLLEGSNVLTVTHPDGSGATLTLENHPIHGPVFSGPHLQPWDCKTSNNGLGPADDEHCNAASIVDYQYVSTGGGGYQSYDPENPPGDVALITNDRGDTVRNIVRREEGSINRGLYAFAYLHDPELGEPDPANPQFGFNGKLYYPFGASCNTNQTQGSMPGVLNQTRLQQGFAVATTSLNVLGHHCNPILSAETAMMTKEKLVEQVGPIRYTMSTGGSGGAIGQMVVSNAYPGITNGLMPGSMFPDPWSTGFEVGDCLLTEAYFPKATPPFTPEQKAAVDGHGFPQSSCAAWIALFVPTGIPGTGCFGGSTIPAGNAATIDPDRDYNPVTNPEGCRATVNDIQVNILGRRMQDGFAKRPLDNVGVQYGLNALNLPPTDLGHIDFSNFIDMNTKIGGVDIDGVASVARTRADPQVSERTYRSSLINDGRGLARAAVINFANSINIEIHTSYHAYAMEARMAKIGHEDNHAIWHSGPGGTAWDTMDAWLAGVEADGGIDPLTGMDPQLIKDNLPPPSAATPLGTTDSCWDNGNGQEPLAACAGATFGDARIEAGMSQAHDVLQCTLKEIDPADYPSLIPFTPAHLAALEQTFPEGVCDYSVDGHGQVESVQWLTYENGPGGEPLGDPPTSSVF